MDNPKLQGKIMSGDVVQIQWLAVYFLPQWNTYCYASTMLNDTTLLEPTAEQHFERTVKYL